MCRFPLVFLAFAVACPGAPQDGPDRARIEVLKGEGTNRLATGDGHRIQVKVIGAAGEPAAGVEVRFTAPPEGKPSVIFSGGRRQAVAKTDEQGIVSSPPVVPVPPAGELRIEIEAILPGRIVTALVYQRNVAGRSHRVAAASATSETQNPAAASAK